MKEVQKTVLVPYEKYERCFSETKDVLEKEVQTDDTGINTDIQKVSTSKDVPKTTGFPPGIHSNKKE